MAVCPIKSSEILVVHLISTSCVLHVSFNSRVQYIYACTRSELDCVTRLFWNRESHPQIRLVYSAKCYNYPLYPYSMSESKFNKAVSIVQNLPKDGPVKPTQDEQLYVCYLFFYKKKITFTSSPDNMHPL